MHGATSYNALWGRPDWRQAPAIELTIPALLAYACTHFPDNEYVVFDDERATFREVERRSAQLARQLLAAGVGKGARVGILLPNSPAFMISYLAVTRIGAVVAPISTLSTATELRHIARHADLHLLIAADRYLNHDYVGRCEDAFDTLRQQRGRLFLPDAPFLREIWIWGDRRPGWARPVELADPPDVDDALLRAVEAEVASGDPATIIYTSGSTAKPKGVIHGQGGLVGQVLKLYSNFPYMPDDRVFSPQPFFWVGGLVMSALQMLVAGGAVVGSIKGASSLLDFLERERVTYVHAYPHVTSALASDPSFAQRDFTRMRGGRLVQAVPERLRPKNQTFSNALGMTETCGPHTVSYFDLPPELRGSLGTSMPGMEHRIRDLETGGDAQPGQPGELMVRGDTLMLGMVKRPRSEVFDAQGWYRTGDVCSLRDGHLFFHGRVDDMIKTAGANVSPPEIEAALRGLPQVAQAYVYGVPDSQRGAIVGAVVVPENGAEPSPEDIRAAMVAQVSSYKVPRVILVMKASDIPSTSSTKIDRLALKALLAQAHDRRPG